jgi:protein SCO1/2
MAVLTCLSENVIARRGPFQKGGAGGATPMQTKTYAVLAGGLTAGLLLALGAFVAVQRGGGTDVAAECDVGAVAGDIGGPFTLVSETGETMTSEQVIDRPSLLYFGYTFCPDVCPLDTVRNAEAVELLAERGYDVRPVFVSVDPGRDTPEVVDAFTDNIHPDMLGLTGSPEQVRAASQAYRTYYNAHDDGDDEFYLVDHSTFSYLVLPERGFAGLFRRELSGADVADRVQCVLDRTGAGS